MCIVGPDLFYEVYSLPSTALTDVNVHAVEALSILGLEPARVILS